MLLRIGGNVSWKKFFFNTRKTADFLNINFKICFKYISAYARKLNMVELL
jgi:hypothetical protein